MIWRDLKERRNALEFIFKRTCRRPVKAVILDLAGTVVDYGSCAPAFAFVELFARHNVQATAKQARAPMGLQKKDHIREMASIAEISEQLEKSLGRPWTEKDIEALYQEFSPLQVDILPRYSKLIPGALKAVEFLKSQGVKIAATTGYNREMMDTVLKEASKQGFHPDSAVCASDVAGGRPAPWMIFRSMEILGVYPPEAVVKIGDTIPDIEDGLNAGAWSVGVTKTGNMLGLTEEEVSRLPLEDLAGRLREAERLMGQAGAHYTMDGIENAVGVIDEINGRLAAGEKP
jgi:phosphonoacetaldehyde hydrolase